MIHRSQECSAVIADALTKLSAYIPLGANRTLICKRDTLACLDATGSAVDPAKSGGFALE